MIRLFLRYELVLAEKNDDYDVCEKYYLIFSNNEVAILKYSDNFLFNLENKKH